MKIIKIILGVILLVGWIYCLVVDDSIHGCLCGLGILAIINDYRINELEDRK